MVNFLQSSEFSTLIMSQNVYSVSKLAIWLWYILANSAKIFARVKVCDTRCSLPVSRAMTQVLNTKYHVSCAEWEIEAQVIEYPTGSQHSSKGY